MRATSGCGVVTTTAVLLVMFCAGGIVLHQWQRAEAASVRESQAREAEASARAAAYEARTETRHLIDFMLHDLGPKLDDANQAGLRQSVAEKVAACYQAHAQDVASSPEQAR